MIDTRELRIGNIVFSGSLGEPLKISGVNEFIITLKREQEIHPLSFFYPGNISPIPLTEAVLMAAGLERQNYGWYLKGEGKNYYHHDFGIFDYSRGKCNDLRLNASACPCPKIESLHYLQNLFYYLHGKELVINMEELKKAVG